MEFQFPISVDNEERNLQKERKNGSYSSCKKLLIKREVCVVFSILEPRYNHITKVFLEAYRFPCKVTCMVHQ